MLEQISPNAVTKLEAVSNSKELESIPFKDQYKAAALSWDQISVVRAYEKGLCFQFTIVLGLRS